MYDLYKGDCLQVMDELIAQGIQVDLILTDLPYGTSLLPWDNIIPFEPMWERINKLVKENSAIVLFGSEPFSSNLRVSNLKNYRYDWVWRKNNSGNFQNARRHPLKFHELISVFYKKLPTYNPQGIIVLDKPLIKQNSERKAGDLYHLHSHLHRDTYEQKVTNYPKSIIEFSRPSKPVHPTEKPVELLEYLIKTYTDEGQTVLDFTMGSGSCGIACINTGRRFVGIELTDKYFDIAKERIKNAYNEKDE